MSSVFDERVGSIAAASADLADVWLDRALAHIVEAYDGSAPRPERVEASRLSVVFAALAVEARLNLVLRERDAAEWPAIAGLPPAEKFRLAPRLLGEPESMWQYRPLLDLAVKLFDLRDDLVFGGARHEGAATERAWRFNPATARAMVEAGAEICTFLAMLAGDERARANGQRVHQAARALHVELPEPPHEQAAWETDDEFPPDVIGS